MLKKPLSQIHCYEPFSSFSLAKLHYSQLGLTVGGEEDIRCLAQITWLLQVAIWGGVAAPREDLAYTVGLNSSELSVCNYLPNAYLLA